MSQEPPRSQPEIQLPQSAAGSVDPQSVEGLFLAALAVPDVDQRRVFLDETCPDAEQRRRVEALLRAYHDAGSFLETPAAGREGEGTQEQDVRGLQWGFPWDFSIGFLASPSETVSFKNPSGVFLPVSFPLASAGLR